ncbi:MAG: DUF1287 domain-containing protein, partial [Pseudomonadota bacterium]
MGQSTRIAASMIGIGLLGAGAAQADPLTNLARAAEDRATHTVIYDPSYVSIPFPGGDVPAHTGVCTDVVIRSYRAIGI